VSVHHWRDVWLNEGFATYSEWLWLAHVFSDPGVPGDIFNDLYSSIPARDGFWDVVVADPTVDHLFDDPVYARGAMTLHVLRDRVGDDSFFEILRRWATSRAYSTGSTPQFVRLAEQVSGDDLKSLFDEWLYSPSKPELATARLAHIEGWQTTHRGETAASKWLAY